MTDSATQSLTDSQLTEIFTVEHAGITLRALVRYGRVTGWIVGASLFRSLPIAEQAAEQMQADIMAVTGGRRVLH